MTLDRESLARLRPSRVGLEATFWKALWSFLGVGLVSFLGVVGAAGAGAADVTGWDLAIVPAFSGGAAAGLQVLANYALAKRDAA